MKIIISRKGFDGEYGGSPSPLIKDKKVQSFPIPSHHGIPYSKVRFSDSHNMTGVMNDLKIWPNKGNGLCHLDPDLDFDSLNRHIEWRGAFGQVGAAQSHLSNQGVGPGDLFLFFGWFKEAECEDKWYQYKDADDLHVLFGYLMVDKVLEIGPETKVPKWLQYHPHCDKEFRKQTGNVIYIAKKEIEPGIPGFGVFNYSDELVLTKPGQSRSKWNLSRDTFGDVDISYHSKNSWKSDYFQSAAKGQEFVIGDNKKVERWALDLVYNHQVTQGKKAA